MAPPACVAASFSSVRGLGNAEDTKLMTDKLVSFAREDILQACVMVAGGDDLSPAAQLLREGGADLNVESASSSFKTVVDVPVERQLASLKDAIQKGLHDWLQATDSSALGPYKEHGAKEIREHGHAVVDIQKSVVDIQTGLQNAIVEIQNFFAIVTEINNKHPANSREVNAKSSQDRDENLEGADGIESDGPTAKGCVDGTGDSRVAAVVSDAIEGGDENSTAATVMAGISAFAIVDEGADVVTSDRADVNVSPSEPVEAIQTICTSSDGDDHAEIPEIGNNPAASSERQAAEVPQHIDTCGLDMSCSESELIAKNDVYENIFEGNINDMNSPRQVDAHHVHAALKVEVSSTESANIGEVDDAATISRSFSFPGLNHVAFCVENLERSLGFYCGLLGLKTNIDRPELPYRGAWLFLGAEGIHLMEVSNPDPVSGRPAHGGYDRHACLNCKNVEGVRLALEKAGIPYQPSIVPSIFTRDPDGNGLEFIEVGA